MQSNKVIDPLSISRVPRGVPPALLANSSTLHIKFILSAQKKEERQIVYSFTFWKGGKYKS